MSEYASSKPSKNEVPLEATIFDDALLDEMAEKHGSYDEARRHLGIKTPEYETPDIEAVPGASVTLEARAIAVSGIFDGINRRNKANGAARQAEDSRSQFSARYRDPEEVASIMHSNAERYVEGHFDTLNATNAMISAGFSAEYVNFEKNTLKRNAKLYEGIGPRNVKIRENLAQKVQNTASRSKA